MIPLKDYVLVRELKEEERSGIILPHDVDKERNTVEIVARGVDCKLPLEVGEKVLLHSYGFDEVEVNGEKLLIGREEHIIAKL